MYLERITWGWSRQVGGRRAAAIPVAAGLGAHQPDWRLRLAAEPQAGGREVQAATIARKTLAYDFFRIQRAPLEGSGNGGRCRWRQQRDDQANRRNGQHEQLNDSVVHVKALLGLEDDWKLAVTTDSKSSWVFSARI